jgi:hypothetical protein
MEIPKINKIVAKKQKEHINTRRFEGIMPVTNVVRNQVKGTELWRRSLLEKGPITEFQKFGSFWGEPIKTKWNVLSDRMMTCLKQMNPNEEPVYVKIFVSVVDPRDLVVWVFFRTSRSEIHDWLFLTNHCYAIRNDVIARR